nr:hypothetical protein BaRGS_020754 [Batillaria attramentaria]
MWKPCCSSHLPCQEVTELEVKVQEARAVLAELSATLRAGETALEGAISQLDQELLLSEKRAEETMKEIDETCDRLEKSVKACRQLS